LSHRVFCMCHPTISYEIIKGECLPLNDPPAQRDVGSLAQEQKQTKRIEKIVCMPSDEESESTSYCVGAATASSSHSKSSLGHLTRTSVVQHLRSLI